ncbi:MAG TPA: radical SAM protein [Steroidobacteraceae bacterium]|nr:radical SAM protein [Steroidobacteraceae bacterium]
MADFETPLFVAWQLTNRCRAHCLACCEESGPDRAWPGELSGSQALELAGQIVAAGVPYVAFGGGEPLSVAHCWQLFERLSAGAVAIKLETDGSLIDERAADELARLGVHCVQISIDGVRAATHERMRPGASHAAALAALERLVARGCPPQWVFVPTRLNLPEILPAFERANQLGCDAFVTGPLMQLGRAALSWRELACAPQQWQEAAEALRARSSQPDCTTRLSIYPWDILEELQRRLEQPQAMLLIVPDGQVKLLNALPFAVADLRRDSLAEAWQSYRRGWQHPQVRAFIRHCRTDPELLRHANATWPLATAAL